MIERGGFSDFVIYAGERGLSTREVRTICVVDALDIEAWLFGGEFLLSSGYIFKDYPEKLCDLIEMSDRCGAAALGVKIGRYIDSIPQDASRAADRLGFPLIGIPFHYAHTDIINPALITIAAQKSEMMERAEEIGRQFLETLLEEDSINAILSLLRGHIHRDIMFLNTATGERHTLSDSAEFGNVAESVPLAFLIDHFPHEAIYMKQPKPAPGAKPYGYLFINRQTRDEGAMSAISHAKSALQLQLKWESELWRVERGRGAQFVQDILYKRFRHSSEILSRCHAHGWNMDGRHAVAIVSVDRARSIQGGPEEPHVSAYEIFRSSIRERGLGDAPYAQLDDGMAFIIKASSDRWREIKASIMDSFVSARSNARSRTGLHLVLGVGAPVDDPISCDKSFREARRIAAMQKESGNPDISCFWEEMGIYRLLAAIHDTQEARDFMTEHLGVLIEHSRKMGAQDSLLQTLFCVIRNNWQLKPVASAMNLHYNTVKYRYKRIGEILSLDLESQDARMSLALAMELYDLNRAERELK
jgi:purine catabolism regulator